MPSHGIDNRRGECRCQLPGTCQVAANRLLVTADYRRGRLSWRKYATCHVMANSPPRCCRPSQGVGSGASLDAPATSRRTVGPPAPTIGAIARVLTHPRPPAPAPAPQPQTSQFHHDPDLTLGGSRNVSGISDRSCHCSHHPDACRATARRQPTTSATPPPQQANMPGHEPPDGSA